MPERYTGCLVFRRKDKIKNPYAVVLTGSVDNDGDRKRIQRQVGSYHTRKEAEKKKSEYDIQLAASTVVAPTHITVGDYLERWLSEYVHTGSYKERSKETYEAVIREHIIPSLGRIMLQELSVKDIDKYYSECRKRQRPLSETTLQQHHAIIHKALQVAMISERLIGSNPAEMVANKPKRRKGGRILASWTEDEFYAVIDAAKMMGPRQSAFYRMALETGMRRGELCGLGWQDVTLLYGEAEIIVRRQLIRAGTNWRLGSPKSGRERRIAISDTLVEDLKEWRVFQEVINRGLEKGARTDFVFTSENGGPLPSNHIGQREFVKLIKAANVRKINFHGMRHTSATLLAARGVQPKVVAERLGHANVSTTMEFYFHTDREVHRDVARSFDRKRNSLKMANSVEASIYKEENDFGGDVNGAGYRH